MSSVLQMFPDLARRIAEQEAEAAKQSESIRQDSAAAIEALAGALRSPRISRIDLEAAQLYVAKALAVANVLDPKEAA